MRRLRVGIVDRSAAIRAVLRRELEAGGDFEMTLWADERELESELDGLDAIVIGRSPDGPHDGGRLLEAARARRIPTILLDSPGTQPNGGGDIAAGGATIALLKPQSPDGWRVLGREIAQVIAEAMARGVQGSAPGKRPAVDLVAIGGSAGGPDATAAMLGEMDAALERVAVVIVQHLSAAFEPSYIAWLQGAAPVSHVAIAADGERLQAGTIRIAPHGVHLVITRNRGCSLDLEGPPVNGHRPSVDRLFQSLVHQDPRRTAAVLLSGMGRDGVDGLACLQDRQFLTLVQNQASSAVFGMPRAAAERGVGLYSDSPTGIGKILRNKILIGKKT